VIQNKDKILRIIIHRCILVGIFCGEL
jgi:hypothetical protein